jgi:hypothetical protein
MLKEDDSQLNRFYQDLIWVLETPPLISTNLYNRIFESAIPPSDLIERLRFFFLPLLKKNQLNENDARNFLKNHISNRLGHYYESLLEFLFLNHPDLQLIHKGYVLEGREGTTLGEFDFILYDSIHKLQIHLEVAVKFYLQFNRESIPSSFIGANFIDRLDRKLYKLQNQIELSSSEEGKQALFGSKKIPLQKIILMQGILFYPWDGKQRIDEFLNPNHLKGNYLNQKNLKKSYSFLSKFLILSKLKWLAAPNRYEWNLGVKFNEFEDQVQNHFLLSTQSLYVARKDFKGQVKFFFVLPDSTPHPQ